jgi:hypothetical protein
MTLVNKVRGIKHIYYETSKQMWDMIEWHLKDNDIFPD